MGTRYTLMGVCANHVDINLNPDGTIEKVKFWGGCDGNLKAISKLVQGKNAQEVADVLRGNDCGGRGTSCADRLAEALETDLARMKEEGTLVES